MTKAKQHKEHPPDGLERAERAASMEVYFCEHGHATLVFMNAAGEAITYAPLDPQMVAELSKVFTAESAQHARSTGFRGRWWGV